MPRSERGKRRQNYAVLVSPSRPHWRAGGHDRQSVLWTPGCGGNRGVPPYDIPPRHAGSRDIPGSRCHDDHPHLRPAEAPAHPQGGPL